MLVLLLNDTYSSYHWGCTATSSVLREAMGGPGFTLNALPVEHTHGMKSTPKSATDFTDPEFIAHFRAENPLLTQFMGDADIIVVNGEGTLHRSHAGPLNLLAMIAIGTQIYGKPVHVVNHSCFPSGSESLADFSVSELYRAAMVSCAGIVAREPISQRAYSALGIRSDLGFDCLPLYVDRHYTPRKYSSGRVVVAGGVNWRPDIAGAFAEALSAVFPGREIVFLGGGMRRPPPEDSLTFEALRQRLPQLSLVNPASLDDWLGEIEAADVLVTGRFHHVVAAIALGTPFIPFSSNTPKVEGVCEMFGFTPPLNPMSPGFTEGVQAFVAQPPNKPGPAHQARAVLGARRNLTWRDARS